MISRVGINQTNLISTQPEKKEVKKTQNSGRVEEIKKQIEAGTYKIDLDKTAKALAKALL
ncbi:MULTISPECIES: flagellar biosynthesis anti-sigma factor FlgM [unclassified Lebetimonas]|uniref:flagellar biosynthesis anti-sigma factor FlgM n=1 Tax=unclassified Lebetimonas TaxID=2648158 RepID=UPI00046735D9|nr:MULTISPECIES: flagellar biosynthesis anti-sigma factor FlgM [unclassified Lebetimonas]